MPRGNPSPVHPPFRPGRHTGRLGHARLGPRRGYPLGASGGPFIDSPKSSSSMNNWVDAASRSSWRRSLRSTVLYGPSPSDHCSGCRSTRLPASGFGGRNRRLRRPQRGGHGAGDLAPAGHQRVQRRRGGSGPGRRGRGDVWPQRHGALRGAQRGARVPGRKLHWSGVAARAHGLPDHAGAARGRHVRGRAGPLGKGTGSGGHRGLPQSVSGGDHRGTGLAGGHRRTGQTHGHGASGSKRGSGALRRVGQCREHSSSTASEQSELQEEAGRDDVGHGSSTGRRRGAGSRLGLELEPDPTLLRAKGSARQPLRLPLPVKPWPAVAGRTIFLFRTSELRAGCFSFFSLICPRIRGAPPFVFGRVGSFPSVLSFVLESGVPRPSFLEGWGLFLLFCHLSPNPGCPALRFWKGGVFSFCSVICPRIRGAPPFVFGRV